MSHPDKKISEAPTPDPANAGAAPHDAQPSHAVAGRGARTTSTSLGWRLRRLAVVVVLLIGTAVLIRTQANTDGQPAKAELQLREVDEEVTLSEGEWAPVREEQRRRIIRLSGSLTADEESRVASRIEGTVDEVLVERGDFVEKGQVVVRLSTTTARLVFKEVEAAAEELRVRLGLASEDAEFSVENLPEVRSAKAQLDLARTNKERDERLRERQVISQSDLDRTLTEYLRASEAYDLARNEGERLRQSYETAKARVATQRQRLAYTEIKAPFGGVVAEKLVARGEHVPAGDPVVRLVKSDPLRLVLTVPEREVAHLEPATEVRFETESAPGREFTGRVTFVGPSLDAGTRSLTVEALVDNPDRRLRPGMFAVAQVEAGATTTVLTIPPEALERAGEQYKVFAVDAAGRVREQIVGVGPVRNGTAEIQQGLSAGERVVLERARVSDGVRVR